MTTNEKKLFLLDAYALIYRAYYAFIKNPRYNSKGQNTSAIFGFTNTLNEIIEKEQPTHIAVVFDPPGPTFRHKIYKPYKAQREETPEDIRSAIPYIKQIVEGYNIPIVEIPEYEADDTIGTLALQAEKEGYTTYMMTPDKDYTQLVTDKILMYKPRRGANKTEEILGVEEVKQQFEIEDTKQVIDILALWGDSSDNVPGCPGIGEKTAKKLIAQFKSVENLIANTNQLKGKQQENIINNIEQIKTSYKLVTIKTDVPLTLKIDDLKLKDKNIETLEKVFDELEFQALTKKILHKQTAASTTLKNASPPLQGTLFGSSTPTPQPTTPSKETDDTATRETITTTSHKYHLVDTKTKRANLLTELSAQKEFCFDTETTGLDPNNSELVGLSFSFKKGEAYYIPIPADTIEAKKIVVEFKNVFEDESILKIGQNIKYDILVLKWYDIKVKGKLFDTMLAHYILQPELKHGMDYLAQTYLNYTPISIETLIGKKGKNQGSMRDVSPEKVSDYACEDADITWQLKEILYKQLQESGTSKLYEEIEGPLINVLAEMEYTGVKIDTYELEEYAKQLQELSQQIKQEIYKMAGDNVEFNIASPKQLGDILFDKMQIDPNAKRTKTGQYSTSEETLVKLKSKHPVIDKILEFRSLTKLLSTYVEALPKLINPKTGRIHTSFNQTVAATGRLSSNHPNLQNIPIRTAQGREIRKAFVPIDNTHVFLSADYSQIELRLIAALSKDADMMRAFNNKEDIHTTTAAKVFGVTEQEVTAEMRRYAKVANFGIIYGISAFGLSQRLNIPRKEAKELIDNYFKTYPHIKEYMNNNIAFAREQGYVKTIKDRKRYLKDINSRNAIVRGNAERNAINAPVQGSAADTIKIAMINIHRRFQEENLQSKMILQVHDELNFDTLKTELATVKEIVKKEMENAIQLPIPLTVEMGVGNNWLEAH